MKPIPGERYTTQEGDSLSRIAAIAYGDSTRWPDIWDANKTTLRSNDPNLIFPGEQIFIPNLPERRLPETSSANRAGDAMTLEIKGRDLLPSSGHILRAIDTGANVFEVVIPWQPGLDTDLDALIAPYSYTPATAWIGNKKLVAGLIYTTETDLARSGATARLVGYTPTADLVDSKLRAPFEFNKITLDDLALKLVKPLGITVVIDVDTGGQFDRVAASQGDSIFAFLSRLAKERGLLATCDTEGNLVITRANVTGKPVASIEEGVSLNVISWGGKFDGRKRFHIYRASGRGPNGEVEASVTDSKVPRSRFQTVAADNATAGNIEAAAQWARNKTLADALTFDLTVQGWFAPDGELWEENQIISVKSPTMFLPNGFDFLIKRVEYKLEESGRSTILSLVPPSVYTQGEIEEPW